MEDINKKKSKILITIGCIVIAIMLSFGTKTIIDYANKDLKEGVREEGPLGELINCPAGEFAVSGSSGCHPCPAGNFCTGGTASPQVCSAGTYSTGGASKCSSCPVGQKCVNGFASNCGAGTYASGGASVCTTCQKGYYCPGATTRKDCPAGYYCPNDGMTDYSGYPCPKGYYCLARTASANQYPCPAGTFNAMLNRTSENACITCADGYVSSAGSESCTKCPVNTYRAPEKDRCMPCGEGYSSPSGSNSKDACVKNVLSLICPSKLDMGGSGKCELKYNGTVVNSNFTIQSSNENIIQVNDLTVSASKKGGNSTITAKYNNETASAYISVDGPTTIGISGSTSLTANSVVQLSAVVSGVGDYDKTIVWGVSGGNATIDANGKLTVDNKSGTITVTATVKGSDVKTSKNITVVCTNGYVEVNKICEKNVPKTLVATLSGNSLYEGESVKVTKAIVTYLDGTEVDVTNNVSVSPMSPLTNPAKNTIYLPGSSSYNDGDTREYTVSYTEEGAKPVTTTGKITLKKLNNAEKTEVKSLKITGDTILLVGETSHLSVYPVYSDGTIGTTDISDKCKWMSSWSNVATVSGGNVNALTVGNTTAVASYSYSIYVDEITKTVAASAPIVVKHKNMPHSIEIDHEKIYLAKDGDSMVSTIKVLNTKGEPIIGLNLSVSGNVYTDVSVSSSGDNYSVTTTSKSTGNVSDTIKICTGIDIATGSRLCVEYDAYIYCDKWHLVSGKMTFDNKYTKAHAHVKETCYYQSPPDKCEQKQDSSGKIVIECTEYYNRCCGNPSPKPDSTVKEACYIDANGNYVWGNYSNDSRYNLVSNKTDRDTCLETPTKKEACYRDKDGIYEWTSTPPEGAVLMNGLDKDNCVAKPACYKNSANDYKWALTAPSGYTLVESIKEDINCKLSDAAACYKDEYNNYVWGDYKDYGYTVVSDIKSAEKCLAPAACYVDKNGEYVWGNYANDTSYSKVDNVTKVEDCGENVIVPPTAANVSTVVYVAIAIMTIFGGGVVYYVYNKKKLESK